MSGRSVPDSFDLRLQKPIRQGLSDKDRSTFEAIITRSFDAIVNDINSRKPTYHTIWRHDWVTILQANSYNEAQLNRAIDYLTISDNSMIISPLDQGACDSCWAVVTASSLTDRFRVSYQDSAFPVLSPSTLMMDLNQAQGKGCCQANSTRNALECVESGPENSRCSSGLETWCCTPYGSESSCLDTFQQSVTYDTASCADGKGIAPGTGMIGFDAIDQSTLKCNVAYNGSGDHRYYTLAGSSRRLSGPFPLSIQEELLSRGTVIGEMKWYPDIQNQCSILSESSFSETGGIYMHSECYPRYKSDFDLVLDRTIQINTETRAFFRTKVEPFGNDLIGLWSLTDENINDHFSPHQDKLPFLQCGFYGIKSSRYMPREFMGPIEKNYGQHAIAIIGWGIQTGVSILQYGVTVDIPYWICRNTYGDRWCGDGYVKIGMSIHSHVYPNEYMFSKLSKFLGLEKTYYGSGLGKELESRASVCPPMVQCGGALTPGVPDLESSNWVTQYQNDLEVNDDWVVDSIEQDVAPVINLLQKPYNGGGQSESWASEIQEFLNSEVNNKTIIIVGLLIAVLIGIQLSKPPRTK